MIWLSSFPRSGNTFIRNVLHEVYGIESSTYHKEDYPVDENYEQYIFVKTHLLPDRLIPSDKTIPAVYLVRDGRDALISIAYHKSNIIEPGTDFKENLKEAILAAAGSYFSGWSINVEEWIKRSSIIIHFEDLIRDPIAQTERLRLIYKDLPKPKIEKLPTFNSQKYGNPKYGSGSKMSGGNKKKEKEITQNWFRKGKINNWKDEFPKSLYDLFWSYHRETMQKFGYTYNDEKCKLNSDFDYELISKLGNIKRETKSKYRILIEANKLLMHQNDGVKRYLSELLKAMYPVSINPDTIWEIDLYINGNTTSLKEFASTLFNTEANENKNNKMSFYRKLIHYTKKTVKTIVPIILYEKAAILYKRLLMKTRLKIGKSKNNYPFLQLNPGLFNNYDLIHVPLPQHYEPFNNIKSNFIITIHDLTHKLFPDFHTKRNIELSEAGFNFFNKNNAHFIAVSEHTKYDMQKYYNIEAKRISTIHEATDYKFKPLFNEHFINIVKSYYRIPIDTEYILTVSTLEPRKNLVNTIKAFKTLIDENPNIDVNLIIVGQKAWKSKELTKLKKNKRVIFPGFVKEEHLPPLYNQAKVLCYVSHYEGFGLPLLEAMSCGTPVIFGNNSSMKELFTNYGLPANPNDIESIKNQMYKIITDKKLHKELSSKALKRSFDFSWRKTAEETLNIYKCVIDKNQPMQSKVR